MIDCNIDPNKIWIGLYQGSNTVRPQKSLNILHFYAKIQHLRHKFSAAT